jgi:hypothetical protein
LGHRHGAHAQSALRRELETKVGSKNRVVLLLCRSGKRSALAAEVAAKAGFTQVFNILEGFEGDHDGGLATRPLQRLALSRACRGNRTDLPGAKDMSHIFDDNSLSIGRTPLVRLNRITDGAPPPCWPRSRAATRPTRSSAALARR